MRCTTTRAAAPLADDQAGGLHRADVVGRGARDGDQRLGQPANRPRALELAQQAGALLADQRLERRVPALDVARVAPGIGERMGDPVERPVLVQAGAG